MKKTLLTLMALGAFAPVFARAQVAATPTDVQSIVQMITDLQVQLLLAKIAELKAEIANLLAAQAKTEQKVDAVVQNTTPAPVVGAAAPAAQSLAKTINVSYYCEGTTNKVKVETDGPYTKALFHINSGKGVDGVNYYGGQYWYSKDWPTGFVTGTFEGTYNYTVSLYNESGNKFLERTGDIVSPNCQ